MRGLVWLVLLAWPLSARAADEIHWTIMGQTAVTFDWRGVETTLDYGTTSGVYTFTAAAVAPSPLPNSSAGPFEEAAITGLTENTLYYYCIGGGPEHTFRTPPPRGDTDYWLGDEADIGSSKYPAVAPTQSALAADEPTVPGDDRPRFVIAQGDLTYGDQDGIGWVDTHFNDVMVWSQDAAYMPSWGNHEWYAAASPPTYLDGLNNYEGRFALPNTQSISGAASAVGNGPGDDWYWFDYGNVRYIAMPSLDFSASRTDWQTGVGPVMSAAQSDPLITFIVVFAHYPAWSSGADHGDNTSLQPTFATLHASYPKFVLALQGHSHHYERSTPASTGGVLNVVAGGGGSACGGLTATAPAWSYTRLDHFHHLKLHVLADRIECFAVCGPDGGGCSGSCTPGEVFDYWNVYPGASTGVASSVHPRSMLPRPGRYDIMGRRVEGPLPSGVYFGRDTVVVR